MNKMINDWVPETRSLLQALAGAGIELVAVNDGEEVHKVEPNKTTRAEVVGWLTATDESWLEVRKDMQCKGCNGRGTSRSKWGTGEVRCDECEGKGHRMVPSELFLVYGNSPGELVADYRHPNAYDYLDLIVNAHYDKWEGRKQPKKEKKKS